MSLDTRLSEIDKKHGLSSGDEEADAVAEKRKKKKGKDGDEEVHEVVLCEGQGFFDRESDLAYVAVSREKLEEADSLSERLDAVDARYGISH